MLFATFYTPKKDKFISMRENGDKKTTLSGPEKLFADISISLSLSTIVFADISISMSLSS